MNYLSWKWPVIITISVAAVSVLVYEGGAMPLRPWVTLWFLLFCPGMAFIQLLQIRDALYEIVLAVALSLVLDLIVAAVVLYAGLWSPELILGILLGLSSAGVLCQLYLWYGVRAKDTIGQI